jgi:hypothetical protein
MYFCMSGLSAVCVDVWVGAAFDARHDAELCQAQLFGIDVRDCLFLHLEA